jgi:hypothetical protein
MFDTEQTTCITPVVVATSGQGQTLAAGIHFALSAGGRHFAHMFMNATAVPNYVGGFAGETHYTLCNGGTCSRTRQAYGQLRREALKVNFHA